MFGKGRDIAASQAREIIHALFPLHEGFHHKEAGGMGHCLDHGGTEDGSALQAL